MQMTGGEAIAGELVRHGVDTVFGLPGVQVYALFDAFDRARLKIVGARHEQGCSYMALGYALSTGKPGVYSVVPGPGILNAAAGIATALARTPIMGITGQLPSAYFGKGRGHLHELPDQLATLRTINKWAEHIDAPADAPRLVAEGFRQMMSGRPGPVALEMCHDTFSVKQDVTLVDPLPLIEQPAIDLDAVTAAAKAIGQAKAPMIMVGGGAFGAAAEIAELAEALDAPVMAFRSGRGIVSDRHPLGVTVASAYKLYPETDLVIGIGSRIEVPGWRWPPHPRPPKIVRIDIDPVELGRFHADHAILADAPAGVRALVDALRKSNVRPSGRRDAIVAAKAATEEAIQRIQPQMSYLRAIREVLPDDGIVVDELSQVGFVSWYGFPVYRPRTFISSGYQGTLGAGFPMSLGVKVAHPDTPVISISGDGGFMFGMPELATAVQYGIDIIALVFNNSSFGNVRRDQSEQYAGRLVGSDLVNPDFVKLAESFGAGGARATTPEELKTCIKRAMAEGGPWLIEIPVPRGGDSSPWEFIRPKPFA